MMFMIGVFQVIAGLVAIFDDDFYVVTQNYTFDLDTSAWGWIHLLLGILLLLAGYGLFSGATWAAVARHRACHPDGDRELLLHPVLPVLVDPRDRLVRVGYLGADASRPPHVATARREGASVTMRPPQFDLRICSSAARRERAELRPCRVATIPTWDSGTSFHAPARSPSGSETTTLVSSPSAASSLLSGYISLSASMRVLKYSDRESRSLEYLNAQMLRPSVVATVI